VHGIAGLERNITEKAVSDQPSALSQKPESTEERSENPRRLCWKESQKEAVAAKSILKADRCRFFTLALFS
jgi:hypothetical protein